MKTRVFYFALAVAAAAIASSCVKEQMEQSQDENGIRITGQVFEAAHEVPVVKSVLDGLTPKWVEGDAIMVSGSDENAVCTFAGENKFQTSEDVKIQAPFYAVYPAADGNTVDRATGVFTASVPSEQIVPDGHNVAAGALVAVAAADEPVLAFKNAVGIVKIDIKRNDILSVKIESTTAGEVIAGKFTMNLDPDAEAEGEEPEINLVADAGATSVTLKPAGEEGAVFASGVYYATVLPCNLSGIKVTFTRTAGETTETASVTKTAATAIARNGGVDLGGFFTYEISTAQELLEWNKASAKWTAWDVVTLTDNIDCADVITSANWKMNTFTGVFDGNNKTIDNFVIEKAGPAAFFGEVKGEAVVKNLTFGEGCSVTTTDVTPSGSVYTAGRVYAASLVCEFEQNASLTGVVNKGDVIATSAGTASKGNYMAGVCAYSTSDGSITGCENYGNITYSSTPLVWTNVGGIAGEAAGTSVFTDCHNHGTILFNGANNGGKSINLAGIAGGSRQSSFRSCSNLGKIWSNASGAASGGTNIGGIVGHNNTVALKLISNCTNGSETDPNAGELLFAGSTSGPVRMGGCVAYIQEVATNVTEFTNYGKMTLSGSKASAATVGGVVGLVACYDTENKIDKSYNYGNITISAAISDGKGGLGGILGAEVTTAKKSDVDVTSAKIVIDDCTNQGKIERNTAASSNFHVGGIAGVFNVEADGITKGDLTNCLNKGTIINTSSGVHAGSKWTYTGGIIGYARASGTIADSDNEGSVTNGICTSGSNACIRLGGIVGGADNGSISRCENRGEVKDESGSTGGAVGGIVGMVKTRDMTISQCYNIKPVSCLFSNSSNQSTIHSRYLAGVVGYSEKNITLDDCDNSGAVTNGAATCLDVNIAGVLGWSNNDTIMTSCDNSGAVTNNAEQGTTIYMSGIVASRNVKGKATNLTSCTSSGAITNNIKTASGKIAMGAFVGFGYNNNFTDCHSTSDVLNNCANDNEYVGGLIGQSENDSGKQITKWTNCSVDADVRTTTVTYSGMLAGRLTDRSTDHQNVTISNVWVKGNHNTTPIDATNYVSKSYGGVSADYINNATGLNYGEYADPVQ